MSRQQFYVYILSNKSRTLYTGMTNDIERRMQEHKSKEIPGFASKYKVSHLVWYVSTNDVEEAILMEKRIKGKRREKKIALIEEQNPGWIDLAADWFSDEQRAQIDCRSDAGESEADTK